MRVTIDGQGQKRPIDLSKAPLLGEGGEAKVFRVDDMAVKLFHAAMANGSAQHLSAQVLSEKKKKIDALMWAALPSSVIRPLAHVRDAQGRFVGYAMEQCQGAADAGQLLRPRHRPASFTLAHACELLRHLHRCLVDIHSANVVVGDLNDGNVLVREREVFLIDVDSVQVTAPSGETLHCRVAHEKYLDPRLYGVDLNTHAGVFSTDSDWYSFAVFAFQLLTLVHPYGGVVDSIPTLLRRAEAMHSAMRKDVRLPKVALSKERLPTALVDYFWSVFEADQRGPFPADLLATRWTQCACGIEHARSLCPNCGGVGTTVRSLHSSSSTSGCMEEVVFATGPKTKIVAADTFGRLRVVVESITALGEHCYSDKDGAEVFRTRAHNRTPHFAGGHLWIVDPQSIESKSSEHPTRFAVDAGPQQCVPFCSAGGYAFAVTSGVLWDLTRQHVIGQCLQGRTRLFGGGQMVLGFYRLDETIVVFTHRVGEARLSDAIVRVPRGTLVDVSVVFDPGASGSALLTLVWNVRGKLVSQWLLVNDRARVVAQRETTLVDGEAGAVATGRCLANGTLLVADDGGLTMYRAASGAGVGQVAPLVATRTFPSAAAYVDPSVQLFPDGQGGLLVVRPQSITRLTLR